MDDFDNLDDLEQRSHRQQNGARTRVRCLVCKTWIDLKDGLERWDLVDCPHCNTRHELTDLRPPRLSLVESGGDFENELAYENDVFSGDDWNNDF